MAGWKSMTEVVEMPADTKERQKGWAAPVQRRQRKSAPIVPPQAVAGNALVLVIAIMTFLSCLTLGAVTLVGESAETWQTQISREATIQIKPAEGLDMEAALASAARIASGFAGVVSTTIIDRQATARLLEPWLGTGLRSEERRVGKEGRTRKGLSAVN